MILLNYIVHIFTIPMFGFASEYIVNSLIKRWLLVRGNLFQCNATDVLCLLIGSVVNAFDYPVFLENPMINLIKLVAKYVIWTQF